MRIPLAAGVGGSVMTGWVLARNVQRDQKKEKKNPYNLSPSGAKY